MNISMKYRYSILGTLGEEDDTNEYLTCSMAVAKEWNQAEFIKPFSHFEEGAESVKKGETSCLLVPGAYPKIKSFIMDSELELAETFSYRIPSLVLAGIQAHKPTSVEKVFHHEATTDLLSETDISFSTNELSSSNSKACLDLLSYGSNAVVITNQLCADHYKLHLYKILRQGLLMPFNCFVKKT